MQKIDSDGLRLALPILAKESLIPPLPLDEFHSKLAGIIVATNNAELRPIIDGLADLALHSGDREQEDESELQDSETGFETTEGGDLGPQRGGFVCSDGNRTYERCNDPLKAPVTSM
jgi:hypothetical protein